MNAREYRAKRIIWEVLRQAGGELGITKLFKAFWLAHLYYSKTARGYLSDWPIVRMPNGPGIDNGDVLLRELALERIIIQEHVAHGPFTEIRCRLTESAMAGDLSEEAIAAIKAAVTDVQKRTASELSEMSHDFSRSWRTTPNGSELDIYSELIPDDVYEDRKRELAEMKKVYDGLFQ